MVAIKNTIIEVLAEEHPATCRGVFYQLVSRGAIAKTEAEYKTVVRVLGTMRLRNEIPFGSIADSTRWMRKPRTWSSLEQALQNTAQTYRRSVWDAQDDYVEIWLEKEALAGVLFGITAEWDVPLMVTRGYPSLSFLHSAAETIADAAKPTFIYYLGDHDPSGLDIPRVVEARLREFAPDAGIVFECIAVTAEQIEEFGLPTRPTKKTDTRAKSFAGGSVEVDAIPPRAMRQIVSERIAGHVDLDVLELLEAVEAEEREVLDRVARREFQL